MMYQTPDFYSNSKLCKWQEMRTSIPFRELLSAGALFIVALLLVPGLTFGQSLNNSKGNNTSSLYEVNASVTDQIPAFPGAEGFGRYTTGGRGGQTYTVTNLNDSGPGSLRFGIEMSGPRIIIFQVSGTIHLQSELRIRNDDISIFGQTAPGDGIAIKGAGSVIDADNVIIQYIRFRPGDISDGEPDALWGRQQKDIIIDHVSMSWSIDETGSFYDNENFTLQWSILSESLYESQHDKGRHGYGGIWGGAGATFHHNLLAHHSSRNPRFNGARYTTTPETELVDFRNNVIYNWGGNSAYAGEEGNHNVVANYYKAGPATNSNRDRILDASTHSSGFDFGKWYVTDNYVHGFPEITADNWNGGVQRVSQSEIEYIRMDEPFDAPALPSEETAEEAFESVLAYAGAILPRRDTIDARIVEEVRTGTATFGGVYGAGSGIIDTQDEVGGWPELFAAEPPIDSDGDGIPDEWEIENGLDPNDPSDATEINSTGYSNLESYIHTITETEEFTPLPGNASLIYPVNLSSIDIQPEFSWGEAPNAEQYEIEIAMGIGEEPVLSEIVSDTLHTFSTELEGNTTYFWRVRGVNDGGGGYWTNYAYFVTRMVTSNEGDGDVPNSFSLRQNYPNPFNPTTQIHYQLPATSQVKLNVYDLTGRELMTLVNEVKQPGLHSVNFDAGSLASGIYLYRIQAITPDGSNQKSYTETRKMTIIK